MLYKLTNDKQIKPCSWKDIDSPLQVIKRDVLNGYIISSTFHSVAPSTESGKCFHFTCAIFPDSETDVEEIESVYVETFEQVLDVHDQYKYKVLTNKLFSD